MPRRRRKKRNGGSAPRAAEPRSTIFEQSEAEFREDYRATLPSPISHVVDRRSGRVANGARSFLNCNNTTMSLSLTASLLPSKLRPFINQFFAWIASHLRGKQLVFSKR